MGSRIPRAESEAPRERAGRYARPIIRLGQRRPDFRIHQACPDGHTRETLGRESPGGCPVADRCRRFNVRELLAAGRPARGDGARRHRAGRCERAGAPGPHARRGWDRRRARSSHRRGPAPARGQDPPRASLGRRRARPALRARGRVRAAAAAPQRGLGARRRAAPRRAAVLRHGAAPRRDAGRAGARLRASPHRSGAPARRPESSRGSGRSTTPGWSTETSPPTTSSWPLTTTARGR